jgi:hypothetical protein
MYQHPSEQEMQNLPTLIGILFYISYIVLFIEGVIIYIKELSVIASSLKVRSQPAFGADETARKAAQITNYLAVRKGPGPIMLYEYVFVFLGSIIYYLLNIQINLFRPSSSHSATERQAFRLR